MCLSNQDLGVLAGGLPRFLIIPSIQRFNQSTNLQSYFELDLGYDFSEKYFIRAVIRRDGTSNFVTNENFFDEFPAVSVGWTITEENFLKENSTINFLKIFAGWGRGFGNANVPFNAQQVNTNAGLWKSELCFGPNQDLVFGASFGSPVLPLQWEVTEEYEAGIDFALFNRKLWVYGFVTITGEIPML